MSPRLRAWLQAQGSLTGHLRKLGSVQVLLLFQGSRGLWPQEQQTIASAAGHVREVLLLLEGRPAVWARSVVPHAALAGPWRALAGLGNRPLADLLFGAHAVPRSALQLHALQRCSPEMQRMQAAVASAEALPRWARSSVFSRHGQPLRVFEAFFPWVGRLYAPFTPCAPPRGCMPHN